MFILFRDNPIKIRLMTVPTQNDKVKAQRVEDGPNIQPIPRINLESPSPINLPREKSHKRANGNANKGPEIRLQNVGKIKMLPKPEKFKKIERKETNIKT